ncbi:MAG: DUF4255 domain-containing protein [Bacteroidia bacterium]
MISESLKIIKAELGRHIGNLNDNGSEKDVVLGNISQLENDETGILKDKVVITLVNSEEESALKNSSSFYRSNGALTFQNPPVYLNLYLLFTANWPGNYEVALSRLSSVMEFFQGKNIFTIQNSPNSIADQESFTDPDFIELRLILDMYTMTFEQINHLWGSLGGKQIPFLMYKMRLVKIDSDKVIREGKVIDETQNGTGVIDN